VVSRDAEKGATITALPKTFRPVALRAGVGPPGTWDCWCVRSSPTRTLHSGCSLLDHLRGTYELLPSWGAHEPVRLAGLFHSIYGMVHFRHQIWPLDDRPTIAGIIGDEAEQLAYLFCTIDRPRALVERWGRGSRADVLLDLFEIEAANLLDQGGGDWLPRIAPFVSEPAREVIAEWSSMVNSVPHGSERISSMADAAGLDTGRGR
jgi:hypothetical protein